MSVGRRGRTSGPSGGKKEAGPVPDCRRQIAGTGTFSDDGKTKKEKMKRIGVERKL